MYRRISAFAICLLFATAAWSIPVEWKQWLPELTRQDDFYSFWSTTTYQSALAKVPAASIAKPFSIFASGRQQTCRGEMTECKDSTLTVPILHLTDWWADDDHIAPLEGKVSLHLTLLPGSSRHDGWAAAGLPDKGACPLRDVVLTARHSLRYILSQPDVHEPRVGIIGEGLGGAVAVALAVLEPDLIAFIAVHEPTPGFHYLKMGTPADSPTVLRPLDRIKTDNGKTDDELRRSITYFDFFNFAPEVRAPALVTMSLEDEVATPEQVLSIYNHLQCKKQLLVTNHEGHLGAGDREDFYQRTYCWLQSIGYAPGGESQQPSDPKRYLLRK